MEKFYSELRYSLQVSTAEGQSHKARNPDTQVFLRISEITGLKKKSNILPYITPGSKKKKIYIYKPKKSRRK